MEHLSLSTVFGERISSMPVSSNKSMIGHTLSAAGAVEAAFSLMTMREGVIPPTINYDNPDPAIVLDVVPNKKRNAEVRSVLSNSFGFGGQNTCLVMIPVLTILGLQFAFLLAGTIIIENVFYLPGLGRLVFQAITQRDLIVVESVVMLLVAAVIAVNLVVDLSYAVVDPRLRSRQ